jgi:hypothetical protein
MESFKGSKDLLIYINPSRLQILLFVALKTVKVLIKRLNLFFIFNYFMLLG